MKKVTGMFNITWTGRSDRIVEKNVVAVASYNPNVVINSGARQAALINWAEQEFRGRHMEYGNKGLIFGTCEVELIEGSYYEIN